MIFDRGYSLPRQYPLSIIIRRGSSMLNNQSKERYKMKFEILYDNLLENVNHNQISDSFSNMMKDKQNIEDAIAKMIHSFCVAHGVSVTSVDIEQKKVRYITTMKDKIIDTKFSFKIEI